MSYIKVFTPSSLLTPFQHSKLHHNRETFHVPLVMQFQFIKILIYNGGQIGLYDHVQL